MARPSNRTSTGSVSPGSSAPGSASGTISKRCPTACSPAEPGPGRGVGGVGGGGGGGGGRGVCARARGAEQAGARGGQGGDERARHEPQHHPFRRVSFCRWGLRRAREGAPPRGKQLV